MIARVEIGQTYRLAHDVGPNLRRGQAVRVEDWRPGLGFLVRRPHAGAEGFADHGDLAGE